MTDRPLPSPAGPLALERRPRRDDDQLQAWDGADRLLLEHLAALDVDGPVWVLNDRFGALAVGALAAGRSVVSLTDSVTTRLATTANCAANDLADSDDVRLDVVAPLGADTIDATVERLGAPGVVLGRFPHSHSLLDHELSLLRPHLAPATPLALGVMAKHLRRPHVERLEPGLGTATVSLAEHKARIVSFTLDDDHRPPPVGPARYLTDQGIQAVGLPGVFSRDRLDPGARVLLAHLDHVLDTDPTDVLDLGCGNGVLGVTVAGRLPAAEVALVDESHLAVASARATVEATGLDEDRFLFSSADRLDHLDDASFDLVVCNPPFHQDQVTGDEVAWNMFHDARRVLRPGGRLAVVANRHLGHHTRLKRLFGSVETISDDPKFVVLLAAR